MQPYSSQISPGVAVAEAEAVAAGEAEAVAVDGPTLLYAPAIACNNPR